MFDFTSTDWLAMALSARVAITATLLSLPFGFAAAYLLVFTRLPGKALFDGLINLPLVLPPVVVGYLLLLALGRHGWLGKILRTFGIQIIFTWKAAVIASMVVGFPLLVRNVTSLSGGERQRVALGRTVLACPRLILMDEPLNGLDEGLKYQIIPYLKRVFAEFDIPLLFISHSLNEMRLMTEDVLEFQAGRLIGQTTAEELARRRMGSSQVGYINLIPLENPRKVGDLQAYPWGGQELVLSVPGTGAAGMFELSSKDITLFKRHPEASSARNVLHCRVTRLFGAGNRVGVEMDCGGQPLVSQVVGEALADLELTPGRELVAVIKASAFRRLY